MGKLEGRVAVVTGAAQGIGKAIAKRLYDDGAKVALLDMNQEMLEEAIRDMAGERGRMAAYRCNVADGEDVDKVFSLILTEWDQVDILVNNAAITRDAMFHKMADEEWRQVLDVNINGVYHCSRAVIGGMRERNYGKIVNMASVSAFGNIGQTNYGMSKAAVIGLTKSLAKENAVKNITVNAIAPSYVDTEMLRAVPEKVMEKFLAAIPAGRLARPEEIAGVAAFLCSDDSSFVTGECIVASGGSYM